MLRTWPAHQRYSLLAEACTAIRLGFFAEAEAILESLGGCASSDAACLNLLGIVHEARRQWKAARRCYGKAIFLDHCYEPAQQNMRRLYELYTFGRSAERVALGDERLALGMLLLAPEYRPQVESREQGGKRQASG
jgi:Flp pilus assembly protein TadD